MNTELLIPYFTKLSPFVKIFISTSKECLVGNFVSHSYTRFTLYEQSCFVQAFVIPSISRKEKMPRKRNWKISEARRVVLQGKAEQAEGIGRRALLGIPNGGQQEEPESPVIAQAQSPVIAQAKSPVIVQAQSPVIAQAQQSPVIVQAQQSPVIAQAQSPVIAQAQSPVIAQATSLVVMRAQCTNCKSILLIENENSINMLDNHSCHHELSDYENMELGSIVPLSTNCCETSRSIGCKIFVHGSFHQGDSKFTFDSRGSQCTMDSLCSLVYAQYSSLSTKENLDEVLVVGDQLYKKVVKNLKQHGKFKHRLLCLDEIPDRLNLLSKVIQVEKRDIISGVAIEHFGDTELPLCTSPCIQPSKMYSMLW